MWALKMVGEMNREGTVVHMCNPTPWQVEVGGLLWILDQLRLHDNYQGARATKQYLSLYCQSILSAQPTSALVKEQCEGEGTVPSHVTL